MLIDQVFLYFLIGVGFVLSLPALWILMRARWPQRVDKLREVAGRNLLVSFLAGIPVVLLIVGLLAGIAFLGRRGDILRLVLVALPGSILVVSTMAGMAGLVAIIGEYVCPGQSAASWKAMLRGGIVMACLLSMPYLGWFALLPVSMILGSGMMVRSFFIRSFHAPQVSAPQPVMTPPPAMPAQMMTPTV